MLPVWLVADETPKLDCLLRRLDHPLAARGHHRSVQNWLAIPHWKQPASVSELAK